MSNQLVPFDQAPPPALPAAFEGLSNIPERQTIPQLSFRGSKWRMVKDGEETPLERKDPETGEMAPIQIMPLVILAVAPNRSRALYGKYEEGKNQAPICRSQDGKVPDADVKDVPHTAEGTPAKTCAECPMSAKGSKVEGQKLLTACSTFKNICVVPSGHIDFTPLRLRLAQTSLWDKDNGENEAQGWYAFDQYIDFIRARGVKHTGQVVTKVKFDPRPSHPKLLFKADVWLDEARLLQVAAAAKKPEVQKALNINEYKENGDEAPAAAAGSAPTAAPVAAAPAAAPARGPGRPRKAAEAAPAAQAAPAPAKAAPNAPVEDEGDPFAGVVAAPAGPPTQSPAAAAAPAPAVKPAAPAPAAVKPTAMSELGSLLDNWDD